MTDTDIDVVAAASARELLRDSFTRIIEHVGEVTEGLTESTLTYRPTPEANSIAWLIWHSARGQDVQICAMTGAEPVWTACGWEQRFGLDLPADATGYGQTPQEAAKVVATGDELRGYYQDVYEMTLRYVDSLTNPELARVVDRHWDPPVTASVRLVSIVDDCTQHLGQAAYVRGIIPAHRDHSS